MECEFNKNQFFIFKLGVTNVQTDISINVSFQNPFPNGLLSVFTVGTYTVATSNIYRVGFPTSNYSINGFKLTNDDYTQDIYWLAIGY